MAIDCPKCVAILNLSYDLDRKSIDLQKKVDDIFSDAVSINNEKWREYADKCNIPVIGRVYQAIWNAPRVLIGINSYYGDRWFKGDYEKIREGAVFLEKMKEKDMKHWGNEMIQNYIGILEFELETEDGTFENFEPTNRIDYYENDFVPPIPEKYNDFYPSGEEIMDTETRKIIPKHKLVDRS